MGLQQGLRVPSMNPQQFGKGLPASCIASENACTSIQFSGQGLPVSDGNGYRDHSTPEENKNLLYKNDTRDGYKDAGKENYD